MIVFDRNQMIEKHVRISNIKVCGPYSMLEWNSEFPGKPLPAIKNAKKALAFYKNHYHPICSLGQDLYDNNGRIDILLSSTTGNHSNYIISAEVTILSEMQT